MAVGAHPSLGLGPLLRLYNQGHQIFGQGEQSGNRLNIGTIKLSNNLECDVSFGMCLSRRLFTSRPPFLTWSSLSSSLEERC